MIRWTYLALLTSLGCSAPEMAPIKPTPRDPFTEPRPQTSRAEVPAADRPPTEADIAAAITEPPPTESDLSAADNTAPPPTGPIELPAVNLADRLPPEPPYSGWTLSAPLALTGPGGATLTTLLRSGVRVEVVEKKGERINVQCTGCEGEWRDAGAWLAADSVYPAGRPAPNDLALAPALSLRAGWARGENLPEGADRGTMCRLIDLGYLTAGEQAIWEQGGGRLVVIQTGDTWEVTEMSAPSQSSWRCRVTRSDDTEQGEAAPQ